MNPSLIITRATTNDIPLIQQLTYKVWPETYKPILTEEQISYMLGMMYSTSSLQQQMDQGHTFILVKDADNSVAFAAYAFYKPGIYKLHKIYALPNQQGKGIGKHIIQYISAELKSLGIVSLQLNVNRCNKAKGFYEKLGFTVIGEEDIDIGNGYFMNDYIMQLVL